MRVTTLYLAWRSLSENRLTSAFLIGAIAAGVGFQVPNSANLDGYRAELVEHGIQAGFGDVRVRASDTTHLAGGRGRADRWRADSRVREVAVALTFPGALGQRGQFQGAPIFGVDMARDDRPFRLLTGQLLPAGEQSGVIVGLALAQRMGVEIGDEVELRVIYRTPQLTPDNNDNDNDADDVPDLGRYTMIVRGLAVGTFGASQSVFLDYHFLTGESGLDDSASLVVLYLHDHDQAGAVAREINATTPDVTATDWMTDDPFIRSAVESIAVMGLISETMILCAVTIPVLALLFIHITHRRRDIGLLAALGFGPRDVFWIFASYSALVGIIGVVIGCGLGYAAICYFQVYPIFQWSGFVIEPVVTLASFARPAGVVFAAVVCAGIVPAWRATRVAPTLVLKGGA